MTFELVVIGTSLGGMDALKVLLPSLPADFPVPVVILQHRQAESEGNLCALLGRYSTLPVHEVEDKDPILPGRIYLAPANYHLLAEPGHFALSTEGPVSYARPSLDVFLESAADAYKKKVVAVILTGANKDGAQGAARIKEHGGFIIVQDPATAESPAMPEAVLEASAVDRVLPLHEMARFLVGLCAAGKG